MYVLVTCFRPLKAWISDLAFCRFCTENYEKGDLENTFVHLTNVAIQKHGDGYNDKHGSKWPLSCLRSFLEVRSVRRQPSAVSRPPSAISAICARIEPAALSCLRSFLEAWSVRRPPSAVSRQPSSVSHQPSAIGHQRHPSGRASSSQPRHSRRRC